MTTEEWVVFYKRQLDAVDAALKWEGTGEGRVSSVWKLQERVQELEQRLSDRDNIEHMPTSGDLL